MNSELKPCPFCSDGDNPKHLKIIYHSCESNLIKCMKREASTCGYDTEEEAIKAWNTRHERTCKPETETLDTVDVGIGFLERLVDNCSDCGEPLTCDYSSNAPWRRVLPNFCPNCGAKVVE